MSDDPGANNERLLDAITALLAAGPERHADPGALQPPPAPTAPAATRGIRGGGRAAHPRRIARFRGGGLARAPSRVPHAGRADRRAVCEAFEGLAEATGSPDGAMRAYRALRGATRATESALRHRRRPASRQPVFPGAESARRRGVAREARAGECPEGQRGHHARLQRTRRTWGVLDVRAGVLRRCATVALVMALHGGSGHGTDFLWTWVREARSRASSWSARRPATARGRSRGGTSTARTWRPSSSGWRGTGTSTRAACC